MASFPDWIRSFRQPNYRRFFFGQVVSMAGTFMQMAAIPWVVWEMTHSVWWLGAASFLNQIPFLVIGPLGGVIADRFDRHSLVLATQTAALSQAGILALLAGLGLLQLGPLVIVIVFLGFTNAIDFPVRQAFTMDLVGREDLSNAIALNATMVHSMRVVGPVLAGFILQHTGAAVCFGVNAVSYLAILAALALMERGKLFPQHRSEENLGVALRGGFRIVRGSPGLWQPLLLVALVALAGGYYLPFLPYFTDQVFHRGPVLLGYLMGTAAIGAVFGAVVLARAKTPRLERWITAGGVLLSCGLVTLACAPTILVALVGLAAIGLGFVWLVSGTNTMVQLRAPAAARGRIVSYLTTAFFGLTPIGSLIAGSLSTRIGVPTTFLLGGITCLAATAWFRWASRRVPRIC